MNNLDAIKNLELYEHFDLKIGLSTRTIVKIKANLYEINDVSSGWLTCIVKIETIEKLLNGKITLLDLNWK